MKKKINLLELANDEANELKELSNKQKKHIYGGGCTCGGTDCGTHGARDGLKDEGKHLR